MSKGSTPALSAEEATALLTGMDVSSFVGLRDRAIIAEMTYTFAVVGTVVARRRGLFLAKEALVVSCGEFQIHR